MRGYIFNMRPCARLFLLLCLSSCAFVSVPIRAASGDVEGSSDYPGWPRMPGFEISDYDEDNPAEYTFSVSRPQAIDASHLEAVPVEGHRYVIRYEWSSTSQPPSLLKTQRYYERLATAAGYTIEKSGAVGNVTETFHLVQTNGQTWVFLNPSVRVNMLTIVESRATTPPVLAATPPPSTSASKSEVTVSAAPAPSTTMTVTVPAPPVAAEDPLATTLIQSGRVVLPLTFLPAKPDLAPGSKPVIDRVIAILKLHPDLSVTVEGHTDLTGDEKYNLTLSKERAQAVCSLLIAGHINHRRLTAVGLGGTQPIADEGTPEGREKNRRIELVIKKPSGKKGSTQKDSTPSQPSEDSSFHGAAPDGVNYYPASAIGPTKPPPAAKASH